MKTEYTILVTGSDLTKFKKEYAIYTKASTQQFALYDVANKDSFIAFCKIFSKANKVELTLMIVDSKNTNSELKIKP